MNKIQFGDCRETMRQWAKDGVKVQMCVTSPPYYGLRDYGHDGQIGLEQTPKDYIEAMCEVFDCVWDILADDGVIWVNIGDSYSSHKDCKSVGQTLAKGTSREDAHVMDKGVSRVRDSKMLKSQGLKNKDLIGIPWMLAFALRDRGWYLRQDIIWSKPNPMPESVQDRCTKAHEYIFLLSKSDKYYFDVESIKEDAVSAGKISGSFKGRQGTANYHAQSGGVGSDAKEYLKRNKRSVWTVNTKPYKGAHFATFPKDLIIPCILSSSKEGDIVFDPFMGSGTTAQVALELGRQYAGCELNEDYKPLQEQRVNEALGYLKIQNSQTDLFIKEKT